MKIIVEIPDYQDKNLKPIPEQLRMHRILAGVDLSDIANKAKVSKQFISAIEKGIRPCPDYIVEIYRNLKLRSGIAFKKP